MSQVRSVALPSSKNRRWTGAIGTTLLALLGGSMMHCNRKTAAPTTVPADPQIVAARQMFRVQQDTRMRGELSPLSRIDYTHLPVGEHSVGTDPHATVRLEAKPESGLQQLGKVKLVVAGEPEQLRVTLQATPAIPRNGVPVNEANLRSGDVLALGRLRLLITGHAKDPAVAVYDPNARTRLDYGGLIYFPDDERYVTRGKLVRYATPKSVQVESSRGEPQSLQALGLMHFTLAGTPLSMEAYSEGPGSDQLFLIFKDQTNAQPEGSYGAGRFLNAKLLPSDEVTLDFNQAWNPLCAYSHYFHCPLPPRTNWLAVPIPAGERTYPAH